MKLLFTHKSALEYWCLNGKAQDKLIRSQAKRVAPTGSKDPSWNSWGLSASACLGSRSSLEWQRGW